MSSLPRSDEHETKPLRTPINHAIQDAWSRELQRLRPTAKERAWPWLLVLCYLSLLMVLGWLQR